MFELVQVELQKRSKGKGRYSGVSVFSSKLKCGDCGAWYGSKVWHSTDPYRKVMSIVKATIESGSEATNRKRGKVVYKAEFSDAPWAVTQRKTIETPPTWDPVPTEVITGSDAPKLEADNLPAVAKGVVTDKDKSAATEDDSLLVWLEIRKLAESAVPQNDLSMLSAEAGRRGLKEGMWLDISLHIVLLGGF